MGLPSWMKSLIRYNNLKFEKKTNAYVINAYCIQGVSGPLANVVCGYESQLKRKDGCIFVFNF